MPEAVIVSTARTPIGRARKGSLVDLRPDDLATSVIASALAKVPELDPGTVNDIHLGCAEPQDEHGGNLARRVSVQLGLDTVPGTTVNRFCSSSLQTTRMALHAIRAGEGDVFISAGVECVSRYRHAGSASPTGDSLNPLFDEARRRTAEYMQTSAAWEDPRNSDRLPDIYIGMGQTAEHVAAAVGVSRRDQDEFAVRSQLLATAATDDGFFAHEITPVMLPDGTLVRGDDGIRRDTTYEAVAALPPVFRPQGTVTAGNCCPLNDGASAVIIMSDARARELGIEPLARIISTGVSGLSPEIMGLGPVAATREALQHAGMKISDVDLVEINEAFAAQVLASQRALAIDMDRLNVHGGAIALGHPFGATGARITTTLLNGLRAKDAQIGLETMCVGGGQGMALLLERLS